MFGKGVLFGVFDGHGDQGDKCAIQASRVVKHSCFERVKYFDGTEKQMFIQDMFKSSYDAANTAMEKDNMGARSGTTAVVTLVDLFEKHSYVANVGDSRCIVVTKAGNIKALSSDHIPDKEEEKQRIMSCGGLVMTSEQYDVLDDSIPSAEPIRVWSKEGKFPGCAFSRSIGDL